MADLRERIASARDALARFDELAYCTSPDTIKRDAAILRFIFAFESVFAAVRHYLQEIELASHASPGACIRASRANGLLTDDQAEALLQSAQDRNRAVHVYDEQTATAMQHRLGKHATMLTAWLAQVEARVVATQTSSTS